MRYSAEASANSAIALGEYTGTFVITMPCWVASGRSNMSTPAVRLEIWRIPAFSSAAYTSGSGEPTCWTVRASKPSSSGMVAAVRISVVSTTLCSG